MNGMVYDLWSTVLKGAAGEMRQELRIDTIGGVENDRRQAIRRRPGGSMDAWAPKAAFYVCMNTPEMAVEHPKLFNGKLAMDYEQTQYFKGRLGIQGDVVVQTAGDDYSLHDTKGAYVSFVNLASVRALSEYMGRHIDPRRFRMNVWMEGLKPFEELTWVDAYPGTREIMVDGYRFRIDDACERCTAINASPILGEYDLMVTDALEAMMRARDYRSPHRGTPRVMGILAAPLQDCTIRKGSLVHLV